MAMISDSYDSYLSALQNQSTPTSPSSVVSNMRAKLGGPDGLRPQPATGGPTSPPALPPRVLPGYAGGTSQVAPPAMTPDQVRALGQRPLPAPTPSPALQAAAAQQAQSENQAAQFGNFGAGLLGAFAPAHPPTNAAMLAIAAQGKQAAAAPGPAAPAPAPAAPVANTPTNPLVGVTHGELNNLLRMRAQLPSINDVAGAQAMALAQRQQLPPTAMENLLLAIRGGNPFGFQQSNALGQGMSAGSQ